MLKIVPAGSLAINFGCKILIYGKPGSGKCLAKGTKVLMFDGSIVPVENIRIGDEVMGPDSKPRKVLSLENGQDVMYKITPVKGESYIVNSVHVLSLRKTGTNEIKNIRVCDWLKENKTTKIRYKGWRTGVEFKSKSLPFSPYFLGLWLGDGSSDELAIHKPDIEIETFLNEYVKEINLKITKSTYVNKCPRYRIVKNERNNKPNILDEEFKKLNLFNNKHIPQIFKINGKKERLELLAGLLDSDGSFCNTYDWISKSEKLANDVCFLARSLGFAAYKKSCTKSCQNNYVNSYWRVSISGNLHEIPLKIARKQATKRLQIKNVLNTGIKISEIGLGEYYGFELDGDGLFLLSDFTVTHNTPLINSAPRPLLCVVEPGMLSMRGSQIAAIECYTPEAIAEFFKWLNNSNEAKQFDTIGIDSISQMSEIILTHELKRNKDGRKAYGEMSRLMMDYCNYLYFMRNKHIYLIAKEQTIDINSVIIKKPYFPGQDLNVKVPHLFDEIFHINYVTLPQQHQPVIGIRTKEAYDCIARDRSGKLNEIEPPDLNYIINKCLN